MRYWEWEDFFINGLLTVFSLGLIALVLGVTTDMVQDRRSFDAQAACLIRRMKPLRPTFSARIICAPDATRRDTTTVEVR